MRRFLTNHSLVVWQVFAVSLFAFLMGYYLNHPNRIPDPQTITYDPYDP
jgi:hypothetical protein